MKKILFASYYSRIVEYFNKSKKPGGNVTPEVRKRVILLCINIVFAMVGLGIIAPILPDIQAWQGASTLQLGYYASSFALARIAANIPAGYLSDKYKKGIITIAGMAILLTGSLVSYFAVSFSYLIVGRVITGIGSSLAMVSIETELLSIADVSNRSTLMSYLVIARRTGASIFPFVGGAIALLFGWRTVFLFCSFLNLIGITIALLPVLKSKKIRGKESGTEIKTDISVPAQDKKDKKKPVLESETTKKGEFAKFFALYALVFTVFLNRNGFERTVLPIYGSIMGLSSLQIGTALSLASVVSLAAIYLGGRSADKYGRKPILLIGLAVLIIGNSLFLNISGYYGFIMANLVFGLAALNTSLPAVIATESVHPSRTGRSLGTVRMFMDIGTVIGPVLLGWVMDLYGLFAPIYMSIAFITACILMIAVFYRRAKE
jgi:MFS family permease